MLPNENPQPGGDSTRPDTRDLAFLREMQDHLIRYKDTRDPSQLQFVETMIADWIDELDEENCDVFSITPAMEVE